jgi:hypothetical protein
MRGIFGPVRLAALLALLYVACPAQATTVRPMNIVDLIDYSETIVAGTVEQVTDGFAANGMPYTEVTVRVLDRFRGADGDTYTFRQFGLSAPRTMPSGKVYLGGRPEGWPSWKVGEVSLLFLYPRARVTGFQTTVGLGYGKLGMGNGYALNSHDNAGLFTNTGIDRDKLSADEQRMFDAKSGPVNAGALKKFLRRVAKERPAPGSQSHE